MPKEKEYSKINKIKLCQKKDKKLIKGTLVLEGGAFRGLYTSGVLDCLLDNGINVNKVIGISAGGLNGANYLAGARGRTATCILKYRNDSRYVGSKAVFENGGIVGFKFMFEDLNNDLKLDVDRILDGSRDLYVGATNLETGKCEYLHPKDEETLYKALQATASMPLLAKIVRIDGKKYLDGGCEIKLPIKYAISNKFEKIIFVGTRPLSYRRKLESPELRLEKVRYKNYPNFLKALRNANKRYNLDAEFLEQLANKKAIIAIAPSKKMSVSRLEGDLEKLGDLYFLGYEDCKAKLQDIKEYLEIK